MQLLLGALTESINPKTETAQKRCFTFIKEERESVNQLKTELPIYVTSLVLVIPHLLKSEAFDSSILCSGSLSPCLRRISYKSEIKLHGYLTKLHTCNPSTQSSSEFVLLSPMNEI